MENIAECEIDCGLIWDKIEFDFVLKILDKSRSAQPKSYDCADSHLFNRVSKSHPSESPIPARARGRELPTCKANILAKVRGLSSKSLHHPLPERIATGWLWPTL